MTSEELRELASTLNAGNHAGTVEDPIPQQLLYTKTAEDGTKKVYTVAAGIAVSGGTGSASPATDTVMGIVKLTDDPETNAPAATGHTALTPNGAKVAIETAKSEITQGIQDSVDSAIDNALADGGKLDNAIDDAIQDKIDSGEIGGGGDGSSSLVLKPGIIAPLDGASNVSVMVQLQASAYKCLLGNENEQRKHREFVISTVSEPVSEVFKKQLNADSTSVDAQLDQQTQYKWRCRDVSVNDLRSVWTDWQTFTTGNAISVDTPTVEVQGGTTNVLETPTFTASAFNITPDQGDTASQHQSTTWRLLSVDDSNVQVWASENDTTNKTTLTLSQDVLQEGKTYIMQAIYNSLSYGSSAAGSVQFSCATSFKYVNQPTITVAGAPDAIKETPTLTASEFSGVAVTHKSTDWQILKADDSSLVWESLNDTTNLLTIKVPKGKLQTSTGYIFKVRFNANEGVSSPYAEATYTTSAQFLRYNYIGIPGTSTFGVGLAEPSDYEAVQLEPADNYDNPEDFQYGLYVRGDFNYVSHKDGVAMKWIPKFYVAPLQANGRNLNSGELQAYLPYVEVTLEQMQEAQRRSPYNALVVAPADKFTSETDANSHGFYLMRGFVDGDKEQDGFFIANTLSQFDVYAMGSISVTNMLYCGAPTKDFAVTAGGLLRANRTDTYSASEHNGSSGGIFKLSEATNAKGNFVSRLEGTPYQCCSVFAWAVIAVLSLIQGQYATDASQCAWYDATLTKNYPKGINSTNKDADDATVVSETVNGSQGDVFVTDGYEKTTHNGSITGITNVNGWLVQFVIGSWNDGSYLMKRSASIYDVTYDNVDSKTAPFYEAHSVSNISAQWGGDKSSFPDLAGADKDLFGVFAFGGNDNNDSNEFGRDYHHRHSSYSAVGVGGSYSYSSYAGVFCRYYYYIDAVDWTNSYDYYGFRAMAYPRVGS